MDLTTESPFTEPNPWFPVREIPVPGISGGGRRCVVGVRGGWKNSGASRNQIPILEIGGFQRGPWWRQHVQNSIGAPALDTQMGWNMVAITENFLPEFNSK